MGKSKKYNFSFTAASLRLNEMVKLVEYVLSHEINDLKKIKDKNVVISNASNRTTVREFREIRKRIELLTKDQRIVLQKSDLVSQKQMAFVAVCKTYDFIKDFTIEVIRDKVLGFDYTINESDFVSFFNRKIDLHPELENFSESTNKKAKQVMYHILEQSGIINNPKSKNIQPQLIESVVANAIINDDPKWLQVLLVSDKDIKQLAS